jgi:phage N-6-adenine-methyltransferase
VSERVAPTGTITGPCLDTTWQTPPELIDPVRAYFGGRIPLDAASTESNPTEALEWRTPTRCGLAEDWTQHEGVFCNPPYGRVLREWLAKMESEAKRGSVVIALLPCARWEQGYMQDALCEANAVCLIRKRVAFMRASTRERVGGNPYANMFVAWNVHAGRFAAAFGARGCVLMLSPLARCPENVRRPAPDLRSGHPSLDGIAVQPGHKREAPDPNKPGSMTLDLFGGQA